MFYFLNWDEKPLSNQVLAILSAGNWDRFLFFVLGTLAKKNFDRVERLIDSKWFLSFCILYYFLVNGVSDLFPTAHIALAIRLSLSLTGLAVIFSFFRNYQGCFSKGTVMGNSLQYIGRRTLDVYLIHFFLLPVNLSFITVFIDYPMPIIEAAVSLVISLMIVAVSLLIGNVIRLSPLLAHYVFGAKLTQENK